MGILEVIELLRAGAERPALAQAVAAFAEQVIESCEQMRDAAIKQARDEAFEQGRLLGQREGAHRERMSQEPRKRGRPPAKSPRPWEKAGISRRTWYRRQKAKP